jgi:hypothetical protein
MVPMEPPEKVRTELKTKRKVRLGRIYQKTRSKKPRMVYGRKGPEGDEEREKRKREKAM